MLCELLKSAIRWKQRDSDLWSVTGVSIEFHRPTLIVTAPDLVVLSTRPIGGVFTSEQVALVA